MNFAEISSKYVGAPFKFGGRNRDEGFDCFSLAFCLARDLGKNPPAAFGELTLDNYAELYSMDEKTAAAAMIEYAEKHLREVPASAAFVGDLLILRDNLGEQFAALHAGNSYIISSFRNLGVSIARLGTFKLDRVFKWEKTY